MSSIFTKIFHGIEHDVKHLVHDVGTVVKDAAKADGEIFKGVGDLVTGNFKGVAKDAKSFAKDTIGYVGAGVDGATSLVKDGIDASPIGLVMNHTGIGHELMNVRSAIGGVLDKSIHEVVKYSPLGLLDMAADHGVFGSLGKSLAHDGESAMNSMFGQPLHEYLTAKDLGEVGAAGATLAVGFMPGVGEGADAARLAEASGSAFSKASAGASAAKEWATGGRSSAGFSKSNGADAGAQEGARTGTGATTASAFEEAAASAKAHGYTMEADGKIHVPLGDSAPPGWEANPQRQGEYYYRAAEEEAHAKSAGFSSAEEYEASREARNTATRTQELQKGASMGTKGATAADLQGNVAALRTSVNGDKEVYREQLQAAYSSTVDALKKGTLNPEQTAAAERFMKALEGDKTNEILKAQRAFHSALGDTTSAKYWSASTEDATKPSSFTSSNDGSPFGTAEFSQGKGF